MREGLTITPGVLFIMLLLLELFNVELVGGELILFGVKLTTGDSGSEFGVVEGDEPEIFAVGGMSIVRVSLPKMRRSRLVCAGNAIGERLGGV